MWWSSVETIKVYIFSKTVMIKVAVGEGSATPRCDSAHPFAHRLMKIGLQ